MLNVIFGLAGRWWKEVKAVHKQSELKMAQRVSLSHLALAIWRSSGDQVPKHKAHTAEQTKIRRQAIYFQLKTGDGDVLVSQVPTVCHCITTINFGSKQFPVSLLLWVYHKSHYNWTQDKSSIIMTFLCSLRKCLQNIGLLLMRVYVIVRRAGGVGRAKGGWWTEDGYWRDEMTGATVGHGCGMVWTSPL